ncbi:transglutaminase domain-containing protein [Acetobacterium carbinolicum]|uniref:transglutaminase domain-containing protein n=1 Tax=Acetobacterium carbinolicum TaxID=52690 RepID=UPI0039C959F0
MSNHRGRKVVAVVVIIMLILLLLAAGAYLALEELVGSMNIQSFFDESEAQQNEEIAESRQQAFDGYAFLEENERQAYTRVVRMLTDFETEVKVSGVNTEEIERVLSAIDYDYPEIFWVGEFSYYYDEYDQKVSKVIIEYPYDETEKDRRQAEIEAAFQEYSSGMSSGMSEYEKVKYAYEYVIKNTVYQEDREDDQNIYSVFGKKGSVCAGYSKAIQYLLKRTGIECSYVAGEAIGQGAHAWNIVRVDGEYYYLDATWGEFNVEDNLEPEKSIFYDYFCVTTAELIKSHRPDQRLIAYPEFTATAANYFVKENKRYDLSKQSEVKRFVRDLEVALNSGEKYFHYAIIDANTISVAEDLMDEVLGSYYWFSSEDSLSNTIELY